jgi:hypothetical protein
MTFTQFAPQRIWVGPHMGGMTASPLASLGEVSTVASAAASGAPSGLPESEPTVESIVVIASGGSIRRHL